MTDVITEVTPGREWLHESENGAVFRTTLDGRLNNHPLDGEVRFGLIGGDKVAFKTELVSIPTDVAVQACFAVEGLDFSHVYVDGQWQDASPHHGFDLPSGLGVHRVGNDVCLISSPAKVGDHMTGIIHNPTSRTEAVKISARCIPCVHMSPLNDRKVFLPQPALVTPVGNMVGGILLPDHQHTSAHWSGEGDELRIPGDGKWHDLRMPSPGRTVIASESNYPGGGRAAIADIENGTITCVSGSGIYAFSLQVWLRIRKRKSFQTRLMRRNHDSGGTAMDERTGTKGLTHVARSYEKRSMSGVEWVGQVRSWSDFSLRYAQFTVTKVSGSHGVRADRDEFVNAVEAQL